MFRLRAAFNDMERIDEPALLTPIALALMQQIAMDQDKRPSFYRFQRIVLLIRLRILPALVLGAIGVTVREAV